MTASFDSMWAALEGVGRDPAGGYRRDAWSDPDLELREWFGEEAGRRGLEVEEDGNGNLWAWWGTPRPGAGGPGARGPDAVVTGSHLDSVRNGGAFDGPLGVVSAFAAVDALRERGAPRSRALAITCFSEEEGARFGVPCLGSRLMTGALDAGRARALTDDDGVTLDEALARAGRDPQAIGADPGRTAQIGVFVELHVEQGRALDVPVGVASAIRPHGRWRFDFHGRADHAGTTRLADRHDPTLDCARLVLGAREAAERLGAVATVGKVRLAPNVTNAIPSRVSAWLDARADEEDTVRALVKELPGEPVEESWTPRVEFDHGLRDRIAALLGGAPVLPTGAGHDAGILAAAGVPSAMLFVRNPTGVSHAPDEYAEPADRHAGVTALATVLEELLR